MNYFVRARMNDELIEPVALQQAVQMSGGVFRELARIMQRATILALTQKHEQVAEADVNRAVAEIRGDFRRILSDNDYRLLLEVYDTNDMRHPGQLAPLMHNLAVLEYINAEPWCDVHPALAPLLDEIRLLLAAGDETGSRESDSGNES